MRDEQVGSVNANEVGGCAPGTLYVIGAAKLFYRPDGWTVARWVDRRTKEEGETVLHFPRTEITPEQFAACELMRWYEEEAGTGAADLGGES